MSANRKYEAYLHSDEWNIKREVALVRAEYACQVCGSKQRLEVHHRSYKRRGTPAEINDLTVLCSECHKHVSKGAKPTTDAETRKASLLTLREKLRVDRVIATFKKDADAVERTDNALKNVSRVLFQDHGIGSDS